VLPEAVRRIPQLIDPASLQPGDLLLVRPERSGGMHALIEAHQRRLWGPDHAQWVHAGIVDEPYGVIEMTTRGVLSAPLWSYQDGEWQFRIRRVRGLSLEGGRLIVKAAYENQKLFKQYDFFGIFRLSRIRSPDDMYKATRPIIKSSICSAFYAKAVSRLGIDLGEGVDYRLVPPAMLSASVLLTDVEMRRLSFQAFEQWWLEDRRTKWFT